MHVQLPGLALHCTVQVLLRVDHRPQTTKKVIKPRRPNQLCGLVVTSGRMLSNIYDTVSKSLGSDANMKVAMIAIG